MWVSLRAGERASEEAGEQVSEEACLRTRDIKNEQYDSLSFRGKKSPEAIFLPNDT